MDSVKSTGEFKEHDSHSARQLLQMSIDSVPQVGDAVLNSQAGLVGEL